MITALLVAAAGGFGAVARFFLDGVVTTRVGARYPVGTAVINLTGSLLLGVVAGLTLARVLSEPGHLVLGAGFLGGYTTFSTASVQAVRLLQDRRYAVALLYAVVPLVLSVLLAAAGLWLGLRA